MNERADWPQYFLGMAAYAATRSTCPRRQVGAVLVRDHRVIATGYNGSLRGQPHCADAGCLMVGGHCKRTVHAELNALLQCAHHGIRVLGASCYCTDSPCAACAAALVQAGVVAVYYGRLHDTDGLDLLYQVGVNVHGVPLPSGSRG